MARSITGSKQLMLAAHLAKNNLIDSSALADFFRTQGNGEATAQVGRNTLPIIDVVVAPEGVVLLTAEGDKPMKSSSVAKELLGHEGLAVFLDVKGKLFPAKTVDRDGVQAKKGATAKVLVAAHILSATDTREVYASIVNAAKDNTYFSPKDESLGGAVSLVYSVSDASIIYVSYDTKHKELQVGFFDHDDADSDVYFNGALSDLQEALKVAEKRGAKFDSKELKKFKDHFVRMITGSLDNPEQEFSDNNGLPSSSSSVDWSKVSDKDLKSLEKKYKDEILDSTGVEPGQMSREDLEYELSHLIKDKVSLDKALRTVSSELDPETIDPEEFTEEDLVEEEPEVEASDEVTPVDEESDPALIVDDEQVADPAGTEVDAASSPYEDLKAKAKREVKDRFALSAILNALNEMDAGADEQDSIDHEVDTLVGNGDKSAAKLVVTFFKGNLTLSTKAEEQPEELPQPLLTEGTRFKAVNSTFTEYNKDFSGASTLYGEPPVDNKEGHVGVVFSYVGQKDKLQLECLCRDGKSDVLFTGSYGDLAKYLKYAVKLGFQFSSKATKEFVNSIRNQYEALQRFRAAKTVSTSGVLSANVITSKDNAKAFATLRVWCQVNGLTCEIYELADDMYTVTVTGQSGTEVSGADIDAQLRASLDKYLSSYEVTADESEADSISFTVEV